MPNPEHDFSKQIAQQEKNPTLPESKKEPIFWSEEELDKGIKLATKAADIFTQIRELEQQSGKTKQISNLLKQLEPIIDQLEKSRQEQEEQERFNAEILDFHDIEIRRDQTVFLKNVARQLLLDELKRYNPNQDPNVLFQQMDNKERQKKLEEFEQRTVRMVKDTKKGYIIMFNCSYSKLTSLPDLPRFLQILECDYNQLQTLPSLPQSLKIFRCCYNQLQIVPDLPQSLQIFYCDSNRLQALPDLPQSLERLSIAKNQFLVLPRLPKTLSWLDCQSNRLSEAEKDKIKDHPNAARYPRDFLF